MKTGFFYFDQVAAHVHRSVIPQFISKYLKIESKTDENIKHVEFMLV